MNTRAQPISPVPDDALPSLEDAERRLRAWQAAPLSPWLTPEGLAASVEIARTEPEVSGSAAGLDHPPAE
jgi:hypothetical protein